MPSLVATKSTPARKPFVRTHYVRTNNAKFSGHYVYPRTETVGAHALRSHQLVEIQSYNKQEIKDCKYFIQIVSIIQQDSVLFLTLQMGCIFFSFYCSVVLW